MRTIVAVSTTTTSPFALVPSIETAWQDVDSSFERFCLTAGIGAIEQEDAQQLVGAPHSRGGGRVGHRWERPCPSSNGLGQSELFGDGGSGSFGLEFRRLSTDVAIVAV